MVVCMSLFVVCAFSGVVYVRLFVVVYLGCLCLLCLCYCVSFGRDGLLCVSVLHHFCCVCVWCCVC